MLHGIPIEVLLTAGYAVFLMSVAVALERMAKHSHRRSEQYEVAGFRFHRDFDRWECPAGQQLHRSEVDNERRVIRYKAPAHACNACRIKSQCTDSHTGREIEREIDSWLKSGIGRFHRGISLALLFLAASLLAIEAARYRQPQAELILGLPFVLVGLLAVRLFFVFSNPARQTALRKKDAGR